MTFSPDDIRLLSHSAPIILRMLRAKEEQTLGRLAGAYRNGEKDFTGIIAEWVTLRDQIRDITNALRSQD